MGSAYFAWGIDVADICGDTRSTADVVKAQRGDELVLLEEKGERLADSSACAEDCDLGLAGGGRGELAGLGENASGRASEHGGDGGGGGGGLRETWV